MRRFVDLHTHSLASDGATAPAEVVALAERKQLAALALTDHDTLAGLPEAVAAARGLPLRFIPGVEMSAPCQKGALHILGLGVDPASPALHRALADLRRFRAERNPRIVARLRQLGMDVTMAELERFAGAGDKADHVVGRLHLANFMVRRGYVRDVDEAFDRFLGAGRPAYVDKERMQARDVIAAIHRAGGVAVMAHPPQTQYANLAQLARGVRELVDCGLDGLEVYHSDHTPQQTRSYLELARRLGLLISGGSDYHGQAKADVRLGRPSVPLEAVRQLLARIAD